MTTATAPSSRTIPGNAMSRAMWMTGNFGAFAPYTQAGDDALFERAHIRPGERVLDAACGAGAFALRAARAGAEVAGIDIATNLVEAAHAQAKGLHVQFDEGDIEALPYNDASFDTVVSQFGAIFAPRPEVVVAEMARVLKPDGRLMLWCWVPDGWVGCLIRTVGRYMPPPPNAPAPLTWGEEDTARARLASHFDHLHFERGTYAMQFPFGATEAMDFFLHNMGPVAMTYAAFPESPRKQELRNDLRQLFEQSNQSRADNWQTTSDYLQIEGRKRA